MLSLAQRRRCRPFGLEQWKSISDVGGIATCQPALAGCPGAKRGAPLPEAKHRTELAAMDSSGGAGSGLNRFLTSGANCAIIRSSLREYSKARDGQAQGGPMHEAVRAIGRSLSPVVERVYVASGKQPHDDEEHKGGTSPRTDSRKRWRRTPSQVRGWLPRTARHSCPARRLGHAHIF